MQQFDPNIPGLIEGNVKTVVVIDPALNFPQLGNHVLNTNDPFQVKVEWEVKGAFEVLWLSALKPFGNWNVQVFAESIGGGPEILLANDNTVVPNPDPSGTATFAVTINVPPNTLQEGDPNSNVSGIYKLVASVFLNSNLPGPGYDMTGFNEGPIIQVENPV